MKKLIAIILAVISILILPSCSFENNNDNITTVENANNTTVSQTSSIIPKDNIFDAEEVSKSFQVTEYKINDDYSYFAVYVVKNTSKFTVDINGIIEAFDGESIVGAKDGGAYAVSPDTEIVLAYSFDEKFTNTKYKFTAQASSLYEGIIQDLSFTTNTAKNKEIITVTNNGTHEIQFVQASALFFKNSELVFLDSKYVTSSDILKPNESKSAEISCSVSYDSMKVFLNGKANK